MRGLQQQRRQAPERNEHGCDSRAHLRHLLPRLQRLGGRAQLACRRRWQRGWGSQR